MIAKPIISMQITHLYPDLTNIRINQTSHLYLINNPLYIHKGNINKKTANWKTSK